MSDAPYFRPEAKAFVAMMAGRRPPMSDEALRMMRAMPEEMILAGFALIDAPFGDLAVDRTLAMPGPAGEIALRLFDARETRPAGPAMVFYHGGGFVLGSIATHASLCAEIARQLDMPVISVEYRLAPENAWPAAPDDAEAAARWVAENGAEIGREIDSLVLCGDSAGGTLTLATALALRDSPAAVPLKLLIPIYPGADTSWSLASMQQFGAPEYGLPRGDMEFYEAAYAPDKASPRHTPILADLAGLPPTVLATASLDPLLDGGRAFTAKLIAAGVTTAYYEAPGNVHGFATYRKGIPSSQDDLGAILRLAKALL